MSLVRVPIYPTRNLATWIDPGARTIEAGTNVTFSVNPDGSIVINAAGGGGGTVTSVDATGSTGLTVGGGPITTSGVLTFTLSANLQSWSGIAPSSKANLASPIFTGDPRAPTPATADNDTSIATTAFVKNQGYATTASLGSYVLKAGDTMTGNLLISTAANSRVTHTAGAVTGAVGAVATEYFIGSSTGHPVTLYQNNIARGSINTSGELTMSTVINANGGLRTFNAGNVKVYDNNNDTPVELGLGYGSGTDRNAFLWNRNNGFLSLGVNNAERMRIAPASIYTTGVPFTVADGDIYTYRTGGTTGVIFLRSDGTRYLYYDGSQYVMPSADLQLGGRLITQGRWIEAIAAGEGFQLVWNVAEAGSGRTESINNRGGGSGGFTWWDRANTSSGLGTKLALLNSSALQLQGAIHPGIGVAGSKMISNVQVSNAAPGALADGTLYLRY